MRRYARYNDKAPRMGLVCHSKRARDGARVVDLCRLHDPLSDPLKRLQGENCPVYRPTHAFLSYRDDAVLWKSG